MTADLAVHVRPLVEPMRAPQRIAGSEREPEAPPPPTAPGTPNPRLRLDGSLGMVVIEFRNAVGEVAHSIPSPRQIAAYRAVVASKTPVPVGVPEFPSVRSAAAPHAELEAQAATA